MHAGMCDGWWLFFIVPICLSWIALNDPINLNELEANRFLVDLISFKCSQSSQWMCDNVAENGYFSFRHRGIISFHSFEWRGEPKILTPILIGKCQPVQFVPNRSLVFVFNCSCPWVCWPIFRYYRRAWAWDFQRSPIKVSPINPIRWLYPTNRLHGLVSFIYRHFYLPLEPPINPC